MRQIAYFSTAAEPQTRELLDTILIKSRINNRREAISGLLVASGNRYMQVIEGPREGADALYAAIRRDRRHLAVKTLLRRTVRDRSFAGWSMAYRRIAALGQLDSFPQTLRYLTRQVGDPRLRRQIELFSRAFISRPATSTPWDPQLPES